MIHNRLIGSLFSSLAYSKYFDRSRARFRRELNELSEWFTEWFSTYLDSILLPCQLHFIDFSAVQKIRLFRRLIEFVTLPFPNPPLYRPNLTPTPWRKEGRRIHESSFHKFQNVNIYLFSYLVIYAFMHSFIHSFSGEQRTIWSHHRSDLRARWTYREYWQGCRDRSLHHSN